jgi:hypothetical protein
MRDSAHIMIDIETMGSTNSAPLMSLAAIHFNLDGDIIKEFYEVIDLKSTMELGMKPDPSTIYWWLVQSDAARFSICSKKKRPVRAVLSDLSDFLKGANKNSRKRYVWANSPSFDLTILKNHYSEAGLKPAWLFWREMDVRTITNMMPEIKKQQKEDAVNAGVTLHNPIEDCRFQIKLLTSTMRELGI